MFASSVAAFYPCVVCVFYNSAGSLRRDAFLRFRWLLRIRSKVEKIVHWMPKILFAAKVMFRGLNRCMSEQELNLLKLPAPVVAQLRTSPAEVVRGNALQAHPLATASDYVPDHILGDAAAPHFSLPCDRSEDFAFPNPSGSCPMIESGFYPVRNGHGANVATFANQIHYGPVSLAHLNVV
jgi:hypothetical protein